VSRAVDRAAGDRTIGALLLNRRGARMDRHGFDTGARLLETVVLVLDTGEETVIHAMPARKMYLKLLP